MSQNQFEDFDPHEKGARQKAECTWARMRAAPSLPHVDKYGGFYVAAKYADMKAALMNHGLFCSGQGITLPAATTRTRHIPAETDQPIHKEYRAIMQSTLLPDKVNAMEASIREIARELLDGFKGQVKVDLFSAYTRPLPVHVMVHFLGLPRADGPVIDQLVEDLHVEVATGVSRGAGPKLTAYAERVIAERKATGDDFVSTVIRGEVEGRPLTFDEQANMVRQVLIGAFDTTSLTISSALWWLAQHPEDAKRLRDEPSLMHVASEEMVRFASASTYLRRTVTADAEFGGAHLHKGDQVLLAFGAANRDPDVFDRPDDLILDRKPNNHLGFGLGVHRCVGSHLGKLQIKVALTELWNRYSQISLDPEGSIAYSAGLGQGIVALPVLLTPN